MRLEKAITLTPGRSARVLEARVGEVRRLIALLPEDLAGSDLLGWVRTREPDILAVLSDCLILPSGETIDDLTLSEARAVLIGWWELHVDFFQSALSALGFALVDPRDSVPTSTAPAPSSVPEDASPPGTGDGDISSEPLH